ncbi:unnamed protein product [Dibothriocephalus latus]|uniref:Uncharacterized protein n=1 Tax=Dibothriocephalus latus TaxID=60516 RepID=A0A3P7PE97_DIBLA|nr:unnamed protein product [Dibothriocephalus latus]
MLSDEDYEQDYESSRSTGRPKKLNTIDEEDSTFGHSSALGPSSSSARNYPTHSGWGRPRVIGDRGGSQNEGRDKNSKVDDFSTGEETEKRLRVDSDTGQSSVGDEEQEYQGAEEEVGASEVESLAISAADLAEEEENEKDDDEEVEEGEEEEEEEEERVEEEGNAGSYSGSRQRRKPSEDMWIRLFVAAHFVDTLLCGVKLLTDWLTCLPINFTTHPHEILEHISLRCRQVLRAEMVSATTEESAETCVRQPLPEDWFLRDLPRLAPVYCTLRFEKGNLEDRIEEHNFALE